MAARKKSTTAPVFPIVRGAPVTVLAGKHAGKAGTVVGFANMADGTKNLHVLLAAGTAQAFKASMRSHLVTATGAAALPVAGWPIPAPAPVAPAAPVKVAKARAKVAAAKS